MRNLSTLFHSRDKPTNRTAGASYSFFMGGSSAGKNVNERSAMQMTAVYSCVRILSEAVAGLPLHMYKYTSDGGKEKAVEHPLYRLLHDEPNPEMSSFVFRETLMTHLLLWGNAYAQIIRNGKGEVIGLYPLMPNKMTVDRDEHGRLYYSYMRQNDEAIQSKDSTVILKPEDVLHIMNLAAASGEDLATTSDIVTDALTAFGLTAEDSAHFADILAAASSNANTNVSMMGETFKYCAPVAGALGYSAEDVAEAIGLMGNAGIKSTQAGTSLRTMMTKLQGELKLSGEALGEVTIQTANADGSMRELSDILADCRTAFSKMSESEAAAAAETLVGKNAMSGFLALMNSAPGDIDKLRNAIENCDGSAEEMAAIMQDNLNGQLTILKSQLEELAISFGEMLMPVIRKVVSAVQGFVDKLNNMDEAQRKTIITIGLVIAALGPFLVILGTVISTVGKSMKAYASAAKGIKKLMVTVKSGTGIFGKLGTALGGISAPVLAIVAVIAVLVAAFTHLWKTNDGFRENIIATWTQIKETVNNFCQGIVDRLNSLGFEFSSITEVLKAVWDGFCNLLGPVFEGAFRFISDTLSTVLDVILNTVDFFIAVFSGDWEGAWEAVKNIFSSIWNGLVSWFTNILETIKGVLDVALGWIGTSWEQVWTNVKNFFTNIWNGIKDFISSTINSISTTISNVITGIKTTVNNVFSAIKTTISNIFNGIKDTATSVWNAIKTAITTPIENAKEKVREAINAIKGFFSGLKLELPHIKLPHFSISGSFSLSPPSVPHINIDWYKSGGIMPYRIARYGYSEVMKHVARNHTNAYFHPPSRGEIDRFLSRFYYLFSKWRNHFGENGG